MKKLIVVIALLVVFVGKASAFTKKGEILSDEQRVVIMEERLKIKKKEIELKKKNKLLNDSIKVELKKKSPDKNKLHSLIREINENKTKIQIANIDLQLKKRSMLSAEQKKQYHSIHHGIDEEDLVEDYEE
ncbi:hypothetical protein ACFL52_05110 [Candidatus Margulisiibacteriota bacterium]